MNYKEEYIDWREKKDSAESLKYKKRWIDYFYDWLNQEGKKPEGINSFDLEKDVLLEHNNEFAYVSTEDLYYTLSEFYRMLERKDKIAKDDNPVRDITLSNVIDKETETEKVLKKGEKTVSTEEVKKMAENAPQPQIRNSVIIKLLYQTGIRSVEAANITTEDIDRDKRQIKVHTAKRDNHTRKLPYDGSLATELHYYIDVKREGLPGSKKHDELFLSSTSDDALSNTQISKVVKKAAYNIGINEVMFTDSRGKDWHKITAHNLRYSFGRRLLENNTNIENIRYLMGHADISTTQDYLDVEDDAVDEMVRDDIPSI
jgi:integrase/recombinase XerD